MENILTVGKQVLILFILIAVGYMCAKGNILTDKGAKVLSDIALVIATPCVIIHSFQREFSVELLWGLLLSFGGACLTQAAAIAVAHLFYRGREARTLVFRMGTVFSNSGFMGLPLQQALLGDIGVFYGSLYVVVFNLLLWTYGKVTMTGEKSGFSFKKLLFTPGVVGLLLGLVVFFLPFDLSDIVSVPISHLAALNTPLPMLFIGYYLSTVDFKTSLKSKELFAAIGMRLLVAPVAGIALLYLVGIRGALLVSLAIACCAPVAAAVPMFAARYDGDVKTAVNLVSVSTVFSFLSMPVIVALTQLIA